MEGPLRVGHARLGAIQPARTWDWSLPTGCGASSGSPGYHPFHRHQSGPVPSGCVRGVV